MTFSDYCIGRLIDKVKSLGLWDNTIIAFSTDGGAISCDDLAPSLSCCDLFGNSGGDWVGCVAEQYGINGNFSADPVVHRWAYDYSVEDAQADYTPQTVTPNEVPSTA